jgi:hypothetical protein
MLDIGLFIWESITGLINNVISDLLITSTLTGLERKDITRRVEQATSEVVKTLIPFLEQERIPIEKQERLISTCIEELKPFTNNPQDLFRGSLDGQKIYDLLYHDRKLPDVILEDDLKDTYALLFPRIATLLCKIPSAIKDWENEAWAENYRRLDDVVVQIKNLFVQVDSLANQPRIIADSTLNKLKRNLSQKVGIQMDITGLRADQPYSGKFDDFFVLPVITKIEKISLEIKENKSVEDNLSKPLECFQKFSCTNNKSVVFGSPGAGKSTWSKWLQRETLKSDWPGIGIRIEFRNLSIDGLPSTHDLIRTSAGIQFTEDLTSEKISFWLEAGYIFFILDGFDEVKPADRASFVDWINDVSDFAKGCPIVITTRPLTTSHLDSLKDEWKGWSIEPFDEERIVTYMSMWFANSPLLQDIDRKINPKELAKNWIIDSTLGPLTGNPLLLSTLLTVHHLDGKLPNGRANLYKRYVDGMLGIWDERHNLSATNIQLTLKEKRRIIQGIALHLFLKETDAIDENELIEWLDKFLLSINITASPKDVLLIIRERTGLLIGPGVYTFAHKTILEFFVAETVLEGTQKDNGGKRIDRFSLLEHRNDDRWNVVIFLWAGIAPSIDVATFIDHSIADKYFSLAYGLLYDQYDKISFENRKTILQECGVTNSALRGFYGWGISGWIKGINFAYGVPSLELNSITHSVNLSSITLEELLRRAIIDGTIKWADFKKSRNNFGWLLFLIFSTTPTDDWGNVLRSYKFWIKDIKSELDTLDLRVTKNMSQLDWCFLIVGRVFSTWSYYLHVDIEKPYKTFVDVFPEFKGIVSLILMNNFYIGQKYRPASFTLPSKFITQSISILLTHELDYLVDEILIGTMNWICWENPDHKPFDLLSFFEKNLPDFRHKKWISEEKDYIEISEMLKKLKRKRNQIIKSQHTMEDR